MYKIGNVFRDSDGDPVMLTKVGPDLALVCLATGQTLSPPQPFLKHLSEAVTQEEVDRLTMYPDELYFVAASPADYFA